MKKDNELSGTIVSCCECGKEEELHWDKGTNEDLTKHKMCFTCNFWREKFEDISNPKWARVKGVSYYINPPTTGDVRFNGFGGSKFKVHFRDGRLDHTKESNNVWCQGDVPPNWQERLPNNAEFIYSK